MPLVCCYGPLLESEMEPMEGMPDYMLFTVGCFAVLEDPPGAIFQVITSGRE